MVFAGFVSSAAFALVVTFEEPTIRAIALLTTFRIPASLMIKITFWQRFHLSARADYNCCSEFILLSS